MRATFTEPHLGEEVLDQYAIGNLRPDLIPTVEEHLLGCGSCQSRLAEADQFVSVFRAAAMEILEAPHAKRQFWTGLFVRRPVQWAAGVAIAVLTAGSF